MALLIGTVLPALSATWSLEEFPLVLIKQSSGEPRIGLSQDGRPMLMGGKTYKHGIGTHAKGEISIRLDGKAEEFSAVVGVSEYQKGTDAKVDFTVEGDGKPLWSSGPMTPTDEPKQVSVKLDGVHLLVLRVGDGGNGVNYDHANWADASIRYSGEAPGPDATLINASTKDVQIKYLVRKDNSLEILEVAARDGKWRAPLGGPLFPGNPWRNGNGPRYCGPVEIVRANGDTALEPLYVSHSSTQEAPGIEHVTIILRDRVYPINVELHLRIYSAENIFEQWMLLKNGTDKTLKVPRLDSMYWQASVKDGVCLEWFESQEGKEAGQPIREKLAPGCRLLESRDGNRHKSGPVPAFALGFGDFPDEEKVPCLVAALSWSANTRLYFDINNRNILETSVGVNQPGQPTVEPGQSLASPVCVYSFSAAGKGPASRNFHRWMRKYGMRDGNRLRPVDNNSWEGSGMDVTEASVLEMMKLSAALGIELYVLDDGWFGKNRNLGDWWVNPTRFPNGLSKLISAGKDLKIGFGIWFEPEMINEGSELFAKHPEWVMRMPGRELARQRNQVALDVANPVVQEFMFKVVDDILKENPGIRYVKWDCNSNINNPYSPYLGPDRQGDMLNRYMTGYYGVMERLVTRYPQVDFQACAAGGGRADIGALRFGHTYWPSDNTNPGYRLGAQWNFSTCIAPMAATCHVTHSGAEFKPKYRFDVSMMGQLGMEVDPRKSEPEYLEAAKVGIAAYKSVRDIVQFGDQYRHQNPFDSKTPSLNYVSSNQDRALVLAYQNGDLNQPVNLNSPVSGLDPARRYRVAEINLPPGDDTPRLVKNATLIQPGSEWMKQGVPLIFSRKNDSAAVTLIAVESGR